MIERWQAMSDLSLLCCTLILVLMHHESVDGSGDMYLPEPNMTER